MSKLRQIIREEVKKAINENTLSVGDKFEVIKSPDSKIMQFLKSAISVFYHRKIQPQKGDVFEILPNRYEKLGGELYTVKNINRPKEFLKVLGPIASEAVVSMPKKWVDLLYSKGYFRSI